MRFNEIITEGSGSNAVTEIVRAFNTHISGNKWKPLDVEMPGTRVWRRGDGSRYRDPGYIVLDKYEIENSSDEEKQKFSKAVLDFWTWLKSVPGMRPIGNVRGEFGSSDYREAIQYKGVYFAITPGNRSIEWGSTSRFKKNPSVWHRKPNNEDAVSEAEDNDTIYKNWRKEVGTDKQTTRDIVSGPSPKPNRSMSDDLAAMNKKLSKKEDAVSEGDEPKKFKVRITCPDGSDKTITVTAKDKEEAGRKALRWAEKEEYEDPTAQVISEAGDTQQTYAIQLLFPNAFNQRSYRTVHTFNATSQDEADRIGAEWVDENLAEMHVGRSTHMPYQVVPYRPHEYDNDTEENLIQQMKQFQDVDPHFRSPEYKKMGDLEQRYNALKTIRAIKSGYFNRTRRAREAQQTASGNRR